MFEGNLTKLQASSANGSNAIAISRDKTTDKFTYLAINSHQPLEGPVAWYEAHLKSDEGWNMMGGLFPGAPVIFHGTNEHLGWAHTVNYPDKIDVYELTLNPENENQYQLDGSWKDFEIETIRLRVKLFLGIPITVKRKVLWSVFGPAIRNDQGVFAFNLSALNEIGAIEQWYEMNKARNLSEFQKALSIVRNPGFNIVYADKYDTIYHIGYARIPLRRSGIEWSGIISASSSELIHRDYHSLSDLPQNLNPSSGFVFNTNNSAFTSSSNGNNPNPSNYNPTMGYDRWENNRSMRLLNLMAQYDQLSYQDFLEIKYDLQLPDSLVYPIDINPLFNNQLQLKDPKAIQLHKLIYAWDKKATLDAIGPAQATHVYSWLKQRLDVPYKGYEIPTTELFEEALIDTYNHFQKYFGTINVRLGEYQLLVRGKREMPMQGVDDVLASMRSIPYKKGRVKAFQGESYIMLVRYSKVGLPVIETINAFGASNQEGSPHYDDQMNLFVQQRRKNMTLNMDKIRANAKKIYHPE